MKYFVYDHERKGSNYYEFYKGKWDGVRARRYQPLRAQLNQPI